MILRGWLKRTDTPEPYAKKGLLEIEGKSLPITSRMRDFGDLDVFIWSGETVIGSGTLSIREYFEHDYEGEVTLQKTRWWAVGTPEESERGRRLALTFSKPRPVMPPAAPGQHWRDKLGEETSHE